MPKAQPGMKRVNNIGRLGYRQSDKWALTGLNNLFIWKSFNYRCSSNNFSPLFGRGLNKFIIFGLNENRCIGQGRFRVVSIKIGI